MQRSLANLNIASASSSGRWDGHSQFLGNPHCKKHVGALLQSRSPSRHVMRIQASAQNPVLKAQQAWTTLKYNAEDKAHRLKQQILFVEALKERIQPWIDWLLQWKEAFVEWWGIRNERYREFIGEETKRIWEWQCRHEAEDAFWTSVVNGAVGILAVVFYEAITPVSVLIAVGPPLWVAWALHGNILKAPTFWALILMLPLKFPPFHPFKWII